MIEKLLIVALKPEWSHLKQHFSFLTDNHVECLYHVHKHAGVALLQTGVGLDKASNKFKEFLTKYACQTVMHFGTSGGLVSDLKIGDLFISTHIQHQNEIIDTSSTLTQALIEHCRHQNIRHCSGKLISVNTALISPAEKKHTAENFNAQAADMESFALAKICKDQNIPYLSVRGIFDTFDENLETLGEPFDQKGNLNSRKIAVNIIKDPKLILKLPELKKRQGIVNQNLSHAVRWFVNPV